MANGLFTTPAQVRAAQMAQLQQQGASGLGGSLFALGSTAGDAFQRGLFGTDTRSPEELRAMEIQSLTQEMNPLNQDSLLQSINNLANAGFQSEAFQLFGMLPQAGKREIRLAADKRQRFVDDQSLVFPDVVAPTEKPKVSFRNFYNPETGNIDVWSMADGKKVENLGVSKPAEDDDINWQFKDEMERKNGDFVSTRFNPKDDSAKGYQMLIDTKDGPRWVQAEAGMRKSIQRTQEVPISSEGSRPGQVRVKAMIAADPVLGATFRGLSLKERDRLAARINDHAEKLVRDNRDLSLAEARDQAFLIAKEHWVKRGTFLGFDLPLNLKTPEELQQEAQDDGFKVVQ